MSAAPAIVRPERLLTTRPDVLAASLVLNLAGLAMPLLLLQLYDRIIPNAGFATLAALLLGVAFAVGMEAVLRYARSSLMIWIAAREEHRLSIAAVLAVLQADPKATPTPGVQATRMAAIAEWRSLRSGELGHSIADLPFVAMYLGFLAWVSPLLAAASLAAAVPCLLAAAALAPVAARALGARAATEAQRHGLTYEVIQAIETLKSLGAEAAMQRRHDRLAASSSASARRSAITAQACNAFAVAAGQCVVACVALVGALEVMREAISPGALAASILLATRGTEPLTRLAAATPSLVRARVARQRIQALLALPPQLHGGLPPGEVQEIRLQRVGIRREDGSALLRHVALSVSRGECIAIRGAGGSGKSRLLEVLAGVEEADEGVVLVDGRRRQLLDPDLLRRQVALVPQVPVLVPGRVIDNLTRFTPSLEPEARRLATELGLDRFLDQHPSGHALVVGGRNSQDVPAAVAERIGLVRALVTGPRVVLFDAANNAQDRDGDSRMLRLLARLKPDTAIVMVSDRPSWLALADRIYRIERGRLEPCAHPEARSFVS